MKWTAFAAAATALAFALPASPALADSVTFNFAEGAIVYTIMGVNPISQTTTDSFVVTPFDIGLGTLTSVGISASGTASIVMDAVYGPLLPSGLAPPPGEGSATAMLSTSISFPPTVTYGSGTTSVSAIGAFASSSPPGTFNQSATITDPVLLAAFLSSAPSLSLVDTLQVTGGYNIWAGPASYVSVVRSFATTVTYNYTPLAPSVPEPASWALLTLGFGLAGLAMRRRKAPARGAIA